MLTEIARKTRSSHGQGPMTTEFIPDLARWPASETERGQSDTARAAVETVLIAAVASILSLLHTGFAFGVDNNVFHLPILARLYDEPQFRDDAFIQSLRHFASGVWMLPLGSADVGRQELIFLSLTFLSRLVNFLGFLCCASLLGIHTLRDRIVFSLVISMTAFLVGSSFAGMGGLFLNTFTHSEIANGTTLLAIYFAAKRRYVGTMTLVGLTFFINAFMAVWLVLPIGCMAVSQLVRGQISLKVLCRDVLLGLVPCLLLTLPVLANILGNPEFGRPIAFDYAHYLRQYFGEHVLIDTIAPSQLVALGGIILLGLASLYRLGATSQPLRAAFAGLLLLYALGAALPLLSTSPTLLNLHLLRSSGIIHLVAGLATAALATRWLRDDRRPLFLLGAVVVLVLTSRTNAFVLSVPLILLGPAVVERWSPSAGPVRLAGYAAIAVAALVVFPMATRVNYAVDRQLAESLAEWRALSDWARGATPPSAIFLTPARATPKPGEDPDQERRDAALTRASIFETEAHRRVWVDYKRGAGAMWSPSYYPIWLTRYTDVGELTSLDQRLAYANRNGIAYVIDRCAAVPADRSPLFRTPRLCVFAAEPAA